MQAGGRVGERADQADPFVEIGCCDQRTKPAGRENQVVIGQDDERGGGRLEPDIAGAGKADVLGRFENGDRRVILQELDRAVGGSVVDDDDFMGRIRKSRQGVEAFLGMLPGVERGDDNCRFDQFSPRKP